MKSILRPALVLLAVFLLIGIAIITYQGIRTLQTLSVVEAERDRWQGATDVIQALNVKDGSVVVDFGSGAGYFTLKLSDAVGSGQVIAVDLRSISLMFLRIRAFLKRKKNIRIIVGEPDDPHLDAATVDSVLIVNTYHELTDSQSILRHLSLALRPQGRLVVVDPTARFLPNVVESELGKSGFHVIRREDSFIRAPDDTFWWLIVATRP